ncbi:MAG: hypothetical protein WBY44_24700 [Bryobacteraceae bacterium]
MGSQDACGGEGKGVQLMDMSVIAGITAVKASLDVAKLLSDLLNRPDIDVADVRVKVHEMLIHMVNAQTGLTEAQQEIMELRRQLDQREEMKALQADMDFETNGGFHVRKSEERRIPYCPLCWTTTDKVVPLQKLREGSYTCSIHSTFHETDEHKQQKAKRSENAQRLPRSGRNSWMRG